MNKTRRNSLIFLASTLLVGLVFLAKQVGSAAPQPAAPAAAEPAAEIERGDAPANRPAPATASAQPSSPSSRSAAEQPAAAAQPKRDTSSAARSAALASKIRATPASAGAWTNVARQVLDGVRGVGDFECHDEGCIVTVTYPDELAFEVGDETLTKSSAFQAYGGWRHRSFEKQASGQVVATWFLMNPSKS